MVSCGGPLPYPVGSMLMLISQIVNDGTFYQTLTYLEQLAGKFPIVEDVCLAYIFCAETQSVNGSHLCASSYVLSSEIAKYSQKTYRELNQKYLEQLERDIKWRSKKLEDKGFGY